MKNETFPSLTDEEMIFLLHDFEPDDFSLEEDVQRRIADKCKQKLPPLQKKSQKPKSIQKKSRRAILAVAAVLIFSISAGYQLIPEVRATMERIFTFLPGSGIEEVSVHPLYFGSDLTISDPNGIVLQNRGPKYANGLLQFELTLKDNRMEFFDLSSDWILTVNGSERQVEPLGWMGGSETEVTINGSYSLAVQEGDTVSLASKKDGYRVEAVMRAPDAITGSELAQAEAHGIHVYAQSEQKGADTLIYLYSRADDKISSKIRTINLLSPTVSESEDSDNPAVNLNPAYSDAVSSPPTGSDELSSINQNNTLLNVDTGDSDSIRQNNIRLIADNREIPLNLPSGYGSDNIPPLTAKGHFDQATLIIPAIDVSINEIGDSVILPIPKKGEILELNQVVPFEDGEVHFKNIRKSNEISSDRGVGLRIDLQLQSKSEDKQLLSIETSRSYGASGADDSDEMSLYVEPGFFDWKHISIKLQHPSYRYRMNLKLPLIREGRVNTLPSKFPD